MVRVRRVAFYYFGFFVIGACGSNQAGLRTNPDSARIPAPLLSHEADSPELDSNFRLANGDTADWNDHPYAVQIMNSSDFVYCSGSIVGRDRILTAAHCVDGRDISEVRIKTLDGIHEASQIVVHPQFTGGVYTLPDPDLPGGEALLLSADIAIVEISKPTNLSPLELYQGDLHRGEELTIVGSGLDENDDGGRLQTGTMTHERYIPLIFGQDEFEDMSHLTIPSSSKQVTCGGDSGAPVLNRDGKLVSVVNGGVSTIMGVCGLGQNASNVVVKHFESWIRGDQTRLYHPLDTTRDGSINPRDALVVINWLGRSGPQPGLAPQELDTTGDGSVTARDALLVINYLSRRDARRQLQALDDAEIRDLALQSMDDSYNPTSVYRGSERWFSMGAKWIYLRRVRRWVFVRPDGSFGLYQGYRSGQVQYMDLDSIGQDVFANPDLFTQAADSLPQN